MSAESGDEPLPVHGAMLIEDFCDATGLDEDAVRDLMRTGRLEGALWRDEERTRLFGILEDELPSRESLVAMGFPVRSDYDPEELGSFEMADSDDDPDVE